jgi:hypothetical protein
MQPPLATASWLAFARAADPPPRYAARPCHHEQTFKLAMKEPD